MKWLVGAASITIILAGVYFFWGEYLRFKAHPDVRMDEICAATKRHIDEGAVPDGLSDAELFRLIRQTKACREYWISGTRPKNPETLLELPSGRCMDAWRVHKSNRIMQADKRKDLNRTLEECGMRGAN